MRLDQQVLREHLGLSKQRVETMNAVTDAVMTWPDKTGVENQGFVQNSFLIGRKVREAQLSMEEHVGRAVQRHGTPNAQHKLQILLDHAENEQETTKQRLATTIRRNGRVPPHKERRAPRTLLIELGDAYTSLRTATVDAAARERAQKAGLTPPTEITVPRHALLNNPMREAPNTYDERITLDWTDRTAQQKLIGAPLQDNGRGRVIGLDHYLQNESYLTRIAQAHHVTGVYNTPHEELLRIATQRRFNDLKTNNPDDHRVYWTKNLLEDVAYTEKTLEEAHRDKQRAIQTLQRTGELHDVHYDETSTQVVTNSFEHYKKQKSRVHNAVRLLRDTYGSEKLETRRGPGKIRPGQAN
jgi:hypothetical protein